MTRMTGPDCAVMCNLINTHTHTHIYMYVVCCLKKNQNAPKNAQRVEND